MAGSIRRRVHFVRRRRPIPNARQNEKRHIIIIESSTNWTTIRSKLNRLFTLKPDIEALIPNGTDKSIKNNPPRKE